MAGRGLWGAAPPALGRGAVTALALAAALIVSGCVQLPPMMQRDEPTETRAVTPVNPNYRTALAPPTAAPLKADRVVVDKSSRQLTLMRGQMELRSYRVALGSNPVGDKLREGDGRTPEGLYLLDWRNPDSQYYLSIHVSYPSPVDEAEAARHGVDPGSSIMIHGLPPEYEWLGERHARTDWTEGCIAVSNAEMDEIWEAVDDGTLIEIRP